MARRTTPCKRFEPGTSAFDNSLAAGGYLAASFCAATDLPAERRREDNIVRHGSGVGFGPAGHWYFFDDIAPAVTFGRAARMSFECNGYVVWQAAHKLMYCPSHNQDERVLHLTGDNVDRTGNEIEHLKRFVQGVKEHRWSSSWHPPTGHITRYNNGNPTKTRTRSLPL